RPADCACPGIARLIWRCWRPPTPRSRGQGARPCGRSAASCGQRTASRRARCRTVSARCCGPIRRRGWRGCSSSPPPGWAACWLTTWGWARPCRRWRISRSSRQRVCPTSVVPTWRAEAGRFAPSLRVLVLHGPDRARDFGAIAQHDLVITSYPLLARDHAVLAAQRWHLVVLDEAQTIKNPAATTSKLARTLDAKLRLCLSGTPLENHLGELWSLFDFLMPAFLGNRQQFGRRYRGPIEKGGDNERQALLA